LEPNLYL